MKILIRETNILKEDFWRRDSYPGGVYHIKCLTPTKGYLTLNKLNKLNSLFKVLTLFVLQFSNR